MTEVSASHSADLEHAELEAVLAALARKPRLVALLRYLAEKAFQGKSDEINEYNIAIEVFGRSEKSFESSKDAIARVEAHRLRKELRDYYQAEGREHAVEISLPAGSYVPVFIRRESAALDVLASESLPSAQQFLKPHFTLDEELLKSNHFNVGKGNQEPQSLKLNGNEDDSGFEEITLERTGGLERSLEQRKSVPRLVLFSALAVLGILGLAGLWLIQHRQSSASGQITQHTEAMQTPTPANAVVVPLRILAGYTGAPVIDSTGMRWEPDQYFHLGGTVQRTEGSVERTSDPVLFNQGRNGYFFYDIPLEPGVYELHLYFATEGRDLSTFSVVANGNHILRGFDINGDAGGPNLADERIFRDVSPDKDGHLHLDFEIEQGMPVLNALALLPGIPHKQAPIRIVAQPTSVTDHNGIIWHPDTYFVNGHAREQRVHVEGTPDPDLYAWERFGNFSYAIPVDTRDRYTLILHFAELYFGTQGSGGGAPGDRVFRVFCNGSTLLDNFDLYKEAGSLHAVTKTFYHLRPSPQGKLNLTFESIVNNATVSAIEVIDESE
ncbi:MAG TPA: malectin domain-containing carbohydrate-binding protein [Terracidiphilus sp.]|nr:malectin domain-containing carbohydrate-binding protein [Terracidiphilus sp.]